MSLPLPSLDQLQPAEFDAGELFSGQTSGRMVKGYKSPCLHTPIWDPHDLFHDAMREVVVWFLDPTDPLYVFGPTGLGKTSRRCVALELVELGRLDDAEIRAAMAGARQTGVLM